MHLPHRFTAACLAAAVLLSTSLAAQSSLRNYGAATAGTGGKQPDLWATTTPRPGATTFGLRIQNGLANARAVGFVALASANTTIGGVGVLIDFGSALQLPFVTLDAQGAMTYKLPVPNAAALVGVTGYAQAFIADGGGAALGFAATQGLRLKLANTGLLLGSRSIGGNQDPQVAVDLLANRLLFFGAAQVNNGNDVHFTRDRTHCLVPAGLGKNVSLFDCRVVPPTFVSSFAAQSIPWSVTLNPDGVRAYVVNQGAANSNPEVQVVWAVPGVTTFGQPFPGGNIKLGNIIDAIRIEFTSDGKLGILGTLGLFGGGADVRKYDTNLSSSNHHKQLANIKFGGEFMFAFTLLPDGKTIAAPMAPLGAPGQIRLIDVATMKVIDIDPIAAGIQSIGKEARGTRTPVGRVVSDVVAGPRGKYDYATNSENLSGKVTYSILRILVDRKDPGFGKWVRIQAGITNSVNALAVSDAGDRLYAATATAINEYDTSNLGAVRRSWNISSVRRLAFR
ncbi:MAG: hypothetical protein ACYTGW_12430 [Planctomycetota bacterium]|jgi:hypothetical protein